MILCILVCPVLRTAVCPVTSLLWWLWEELLIFQFIQQLFTCWDGVEPLSSVHAGLETESPPLAILFNFWSYFLLSSCLVVFYFVLEIIIVHFKGRRLSFIHSSIKFLADLVHLSRPCFVIGLCVSILVLLLSLNHGPTVECGHYSRMTFCGLRWVPTVIREVFLLDVACCIPKSSGLIDFVWF